MNDRTHELLYRNLQEVFGEGDATRRRAAIEDSMPRTACSTCLRVYSSVTTLSTNSQGIYARRTRTSFTHRTANLRLSTTPVVWLGALARAAQHPNIRAWM